MLLHLSASKHFPMLQRIPARCRHLAVICLITLALLSFAFFPSASRVASYSSSSLSSELEENELSAIEARIKELQRKYEALAIEKKLIPAALRDEHASLTGGAEVNRGPLIPIENFSTDVKHNLHSGSNVYDARGLQMRPTPINNSKTLHGDDKSSDLVPAIRPSSRDVPAMVADIPQHRAHWVDCAKLFAGDAAETARARKYGREKMKAEEVGKAAQNCPRFIGERRYVMSPLSAEEEGFSIAFSIIMHAEVEHFERLLRAVYRPQNHYCVHVDSKAEPATRAAVEAIVACFTNVFIPSRAIDVQWGKFSLVEPELLCMEELLARSRAWRYFINLTGQEWPLKTNLDIVRILRAFNGSNNMEGTVERRDDTRVTNKPAPPVPVTLTKGSVHIVVTRDFCRYVLYNREALAFKEWVKDTYIPDETFFSSLNHSPQLGVPGAYLGKPETDMGNYMFIARFKNWGDGPFNWPCAGQRVRYICIFGVGDLPLLASRPELFANKFYSDFEPATLDCMEELHFNRTRDELLGVVNFDASFYRTLAFVKNHI